ncbi:MAG: hypothetical protein RLZZ337_1505 [Bacteroidota bacterium]|jgi:hypothetical protein
MKTRNISAATLVSAVILFNFTSCGYEDGPAISLRSKNGRLIGKWDAQIVAGELLQSNSNETQTVIMEFEKDGDLKFEFSYSYSYYGQTYESSYSYLGTWEWKENKDEMLLAIDGELIYAEILKLTNDEFSFEDNDGEKWEFEKID